MVTSSVPLVAFVPDQVPEAVQDVALVEDQVRVTTVSINTDEDDEERDEVGLGSEGVGDPPPPPPPPQETTNNNTNKFTQTNLEIDFIYPSFLKHLYIYKHNMCFFETRI